MSTKKAVVAVNILKSMQAKVVVSLFTMPRSLLFSNENIKGNQFSGADRELAYTGNFLRGRKTMVRFYLQSPAKYGTRNKTGRSWILSKNNKGRINIGK